MSTKPASSPYRKLIRDFALVDGGGVYEANDHFLFVNGLVYQRYRRFFFHQIQAIQVRPTRRWCYLILANIAIIAALVFGITYGFTVPLAFETLPVKAMLYGALVTPFALFLLFQIVRLILFGASQEVIIQTAVQRTVIPPLGYRRRSRKTLARMCECVEAIQGKATKASIQEDLAAWSGAPRSTSAVGVQKSA